MLDPSPVPPVDAGGESTMVVDPAASDAGSPLATSGIATADEGWFNARLEDGECLIEKGFSALEMLLPLRGDQPTAPRRDGAGVDHRQTRRVG